jgi:acetyl esterase/lipase
VTVTEEVLAGRDAPVRLRIYRTRAGAPAPLLLWMHGGAFIGGGLDMPEADVVCRALAAVGVACVSVDYRLAPGFGDRRAQKSGDAVRHPLPVDDCATAWQWAVDNAAGLGVDPDRMFVGGASAGGTLAANLALRLASRDSGIMPAGALLAYPLLHADLPAYGQDLRRSLRGWRRLGTFTGASVRWMARNYVGSRDPSRIVAAFPGGSDLTRFPPTLIVNSERDSLRASGERFAQELAAHGRPVECSVEAGTSHGHLNRPGRAPFHATISTMGNRLTR